MKNSKFLLTSLLAAATMSATAYSDESVTWNVDSGHVYKWTGNAGGDAFATANNWVTGTYSGGNVEFGSNTGTPSRTSNKGYVLYFDSGVEVSGGGDSDTSDGGGIWVTGTGNTVTVSMGRWAGSIQVDAGNVLTTSWSNQLKDGKIVANGNAVVNVASGNLNFDTGGVRTWYTGENGQINIQSATGISNSGSVSATGVGTVTFNTLTSIAAGSYVEAAGATVDFNSKTVSGAGSIKLSSGTIQNLTVGSGGTLAVEGSGSLSNVTFSAGSIFDLSGATLSSDTALLIASGSVTFNSAQKIVLSSSLTSGTYKIFDAGTNLADWTSLGKSNIDFFASGIGARGTSVSFANSGEMTITIGTEDPASLVWNGASGNSTWNTDTSNTNWTNGASPDSFYTLDSVTFDKNATVTVDSAGVTAGKVTIASGTVTFTGGTITAVGGVSVTGGSLALGTAFSVSAGTSFNVTGSGTVSGTISSMAAGSSLTLAGTTASTMTITGSIADDATLNIQNGSLTWTHDGRGTSAGITIGAGSTFKDEAFYKYSLTLRGTLSGAGTLYSGVPTNESQGDGFRTVTLSGSTAGFTGEWQLETAYSGNANGNRRIDGVLNSSDGKFGGVVNFTVLPGTGDNVVRDTKTSSKLSLAKNMEIGGLKGTLSNTVVGSNNTDSRALTINTVADANYDYAGTIASTISGITKKGAGTQILSGDNSAYAGTTTVEAGTLGIGYANALGSGPVTVKSGATLARGIDGTVNVGGAFTTEGAAILDLGTLGAGTAAITATGAVTISSGTIFDMTEATTGLKLVSGSSVTASGLGIANLSVGGALVNQRGTATFAVENNTLVLSAYTAGGVLDITWADGEAGVWKENGSGWTKDSTAQTFQQGDSVTFGSDAAKKNVSVAGALNTGTIEVNDNYTFAFADGASVSGTTLTVADGSTLTLSGTGTLAVTGHSATGSVALGADTTYAIDVSAAPSDLSLANVTGDAASTLEINASSDAGDNTDYHFTKITGMSSEFLGTLKVTGGFLNLGDPSAVNGSNVKEVVLSGRIGDSSKTGSGLCFMNVNGGLTFSKDIVAEGEGGVLRSYASKNYSVNFTGSVTGTTIRHSDGGTHKFSGTVDLQKFVQSGATGGETVTEFAGTTTLGTLELATGTATFSSTNATITTANVSGGEVNFTGNTTLGTLSNSNGAETDPVGGTVNLGGTSTGTTTLAANAGTLNIGSTWNLTSSVSLGGTININGGTLTLTGNETAQTAAFNVNAGGTLKVTGHDSFRWNNSVAADTSGNIVMQGAEGNLAKFVVADKDSKGAASMTLSKNITLNGHTLISSEGGSSFNTFGGKISVAGTDNTISSKIEIRAPLVIEVGDSAELLISGVVANNISDTTRGGAFRKTGNGTLTLSEANTYTYSTTIEAGTVIAKNVKAFGTLAAEKSLTVKDRARLQISKSNVNLGNAGEGVVLEQGAKLVIDYANLTETAASTATEKTFEIMTAAVFSIYGNTLSAGDVTSKMTDAWELLGGDSAWLDSAKWTLADNTLSLTLTIPEPSMFGLLAGLGALALAGTRRRRRKA